MLCIITRAFYITETLLVNRMHKLVRLHKDFSGQSCLKNKRIESCSKQEQGSRCAACLCVFYCVCSFLCVCVNKLGSSSPPVEMSSWEEAFRGIPVNRGGCVSIWDTGCGLKPPEVQTLKAIRAQSSTDPAKSPQGLGCQIKVLWRQRARKPVSETAEKIQTDSHSGSLSRKEMLKNEINILINLQLTEVEQLLCRNTIFVKYLLVWQ